MDKFNLIVALCIGNAAFIKMIMLEGYDTLPIDTLKNKFLKDFESLFSPRVLGTPFLGKEGQGQFPRHTADMLAVEEAVLFVWGLPTM